MIDLIFQIGGGVLSFWLAIKYVPGVEFIGETGHLIMAGAFLGLINFFIKPIIRILTTPIRILTLGVFSLIMNMAIIWFTSVIFPELVIHGLLPLFKVTFIVWLVGYFLGFSSAKTK